MKKIFLKMPFFIKSILVNVYGYFLAKKTFTKNFYRTLDNYMRLDYSDHPGFNKEIFESQLMGNKFYEIKEIDEYEIIDRNFVKSRFDRIMNKKHIYGYWHTSGTTGAGLKLPISQKFIEHQRAVHWKFRNIHGFGPNDWWAYILGKTIFSTDNRKPPFWIKSYGTRQLLLSQYHLNEDSAEIYLRQILKNNIKLLHAFPSVLTNLANLIIKQNLQELAKQLKLRVITTSSETLLDHQREKIESVFYCRVRELYGLIEGVANFFECEEGTLHVDEQFSHVEFLPQAGSREYKIIGTSYHNKAFPLVRYDTGDTCTLYDSNFECPCQRKNRTVKKILGRNDDYLLLGDGTKIGRLSHLTKHITEIDEAQIYQEQAGKATFRIVKGKNYGDEDERALIAEIREKLGKDFIYEFEYLPAIPRTKAGKLKLVVRK